MATWISSVRTVAGDYNAEDLEAAVNRRALIGNLLSEWQKRSGGRRTVAFAVSVAHSKALCEAFVAEGARAGHIDGTTPEGERATTLALLERGVLDIVWNVGVLCEGWDQPSCKCLVLARPTKSMGLYMQMAGRILRPWGSQPPLILDHGGNVDRHGMPHIDRDWSLEGKIKKSSAAPCKACPVCFVYVNAGLRVCPCGHVFDVAQCEAADAEEEMVPVELALRTLDGPDAQLDFFRKTARTAAERGWKPGAIAIRFRERFGQYPPAGWMPAAKQGLKADPEYVARFERRQAAVQTEAAE